MAPKATTTTAPGIHQRRPKRRIANTSTAPPIAEKTAPMPAALAWSPSQSGHAWVTSPTSFARSRARAASGSATTAVVTEIAAATAAPARFGRRMSSSRRGGRRTISASTASPSAVCAT